MFSVSRLSASAAVALALAACSFPATDANAVTIIAEFGDDFSATTNIHTPSHGNGTWAYYWNRPDNWTAGGSAYVGTTGLLGDTSRYALLVNTGNAGTPWTADGDVDGTNSNPDRYVRFGAYNSSSDSVSLHPGAQPGFSTNQVDRYAIAAFTVATTDFYHLVDGRLWTGSALSDGVDVWVHVNNGTPVKLGVSTGGTGSSTAFTYSYAFGELQAGDTIYVAFGTNGNPSSDGSAANFAIAVPEPSRALLLAAGGLLILLGRRRVWFN